MPHIATVSSAHRVSGIVRCAVSLNKNMVQAQTLAALAIGGRLGFNGRSRHYMAGNARPRKRP